MPRDMDRAADHPETERDPDEKPTLRQVVHAATGDREREAEALADRADDVDDDTAQRAVAEAHGDVASDRSTGDRDIAVPGDARAVRDDTSDDTTDGGA